jgi:hypothetical protein
MAALSEGEAAEIDAFLREEKRLDGPHPIWHAASRPGEMSAVWDVQDSLDITRAALRFRCSLETLACPSVSLIFHRNAIWRIDLVPAHESKPNPLGASALRLPARVHGSHAHTWWHNRDYLLSQDLWDLPYRSPLDGPIRKLEQAVASLANAVNIVLKPHQRGFDVPPQADLFGRR